MLEVKQEMVLFPTEEQYALKYGELLISCCYWTIPFYPKQRENLINSKIYFYLRSENVIMNRATIIEFGERDGKKTVVFEFTDDDYEFEPIDLDHLGIPQKTQNRGWCYRFW